jgi:hypothetical protein
MAQAQARSLHAHAGRPHPHGGPCSTCSGNAHTFAAQQHPASRRADTVPSGDPPVQQLTPGGPCRCVWNQKTCSAEDRAASRAAVRRGAASCRSGCCLPCLSRLPAATADLAVRNAWKVAVCMLQEMVVLGGGRCYVVGGLFQSVLWVEIDSVMVGSRR